MNLIEKVVEAHEKRLIARAVGEVDDCNIILNLKYNAKYDHLPYFISVRNEDTMLLEVNSYKLREDAEKEFDELVEKYKLKLDMPEKKWWLGEEK